MTHPQRGAGVENGPAGGNPGFPHRSRERVQKSSHITILGSFVTAQLAIQRGGPTDKKLAAAEGALFHGESRVYMFCGTHRWPNPIIRIVVPVSW